MNSKKIRKHKNNLWLFLILGIIILAIPYTIKFISGDSSFVGEESYYHARMLEQARNYGISSIDLLTNKPYSFNFFHFLVGFSGLTTDMAVKILPILMGLISLIIVYFLFKELNLDVENLTFSIIILFLSPIFIFTFTAFTSEAFAFILLTLSAYLYLKKNYWSVLPLSFLVLTNFIASLAAILFIVSLIFTKRASIKFALINFGAFILTIICGVLFLKFNPLIVFSLGVIDISNVFISFGSLKSFSIVMLILAILGLDIVWRRNLSQTFIYSLVLILFVASLFFIELRLLVALIFAILSGSALSYLINKSWSIPILKNITLLLIVCSLIFSTALFYRIQITEMSYEKIDAIKYLSASEKDDIILSAEQNGFVIEYLSGRAAYLDGNSYRFSDYEDRLKTAALIYYSRNLNELSLILEETGINHFLVDQNMLSGKVWNSEDEGVLFLFKRSKSFVTVFSGEEIKLYRFVD